MGRQAIYAKLIGLQPIAQLFPSKLVIDGFPSRHFLWAYAVQLDWQWRSGRLGEGMDISPDSWWGAMNYTLSVCPLAGAVDAGLLEAKEVATVDFKETVLQVESC